MFDFGGAELLVIGLLAVTVLGPREMAKLLKTAGRLYGSVKRQWDDLREGIEDIGREDELARIAELRQAAATRGRSLQRQAPRLDDVEADGSEPDANDVLINRPTHADKLL